MASIGIIGVGNIGSTLMHLLSSSPGLHLFLYDKNLNAMRGRIEDLRQASLLGKSYPKIEVVEDLSCLFACDVLVITAGKARKPGMDRLELLQANQTLINDLAHTLKPAKGHVIVVTNPVDIMTAQFFHTSQWPTHRVMGMAGLLDSVRLRYALTSYSTKNPLDTEGMVIGPHNDAMIPVRSSVKISGQSLDQLGLKNHWKNIIDQTRYGGKMIVDLLQTGSAFYGPAHCLKIMINSIIFNEKRLISCTTRAKGVYDIEKDVFLSLPVILGKGGAENIIPIALEAEELEKLHQQATILSRIALY